MDKFNKRGEAFKALHIKQLELEYWKYISYLQEVNGNCSIADAVRASLKNSYVMKAYAEAK